MKEEEKLCSKKTLYSWSGAPEVFSNSEGHRMEGKGTCISVTIQESDVILLRRSRRRGTYATHYVGSGAGS